MKNNKRTLKNIIMIAVAVLMIAALIFTTGIVRLGGGDMPSGAQGQPPQTQSEDGTVEVKELSDDTDEDSSAKSDEDSSAKSDKGSSAKSGEEPPEKPDFEDGEEPPEPPEGMEKPDGENAPDFENGEKPGGMPGGMGITKFILAGAEGLVFALVLMYLIMSGFNRKTFKETLPTAKKKIIYIVVTVLVGAAMFAAATFVPMKLMGAGGGPGGPGQLPDGQTNEVTELQDSDSDTNQQDSDEEETEQ